jgi:hypothetical protein
MDYPISSEPGVRTQSCHSSPPPFIPPPLQVGLAPLAQYGAEPGQARVLSGEG